MVMLNKNLRRLTTLFFFSTLLYVPSVTHSSEDLSLPSEDCSFAGSFTQSKDIDGLPDPLLSEGAFYYHCKAGVIWKTQSPVSQTFVFRKTGKAFNIQQQEVVALKSRQGKILGRLLNSLIGGDQSELSDQFEIVSRPKVDCDETKRFSLKPRKRSLKRGLQTIELDLAQPTSGQAVSVDIAMLDRKDQWTRISSTKTVSLDDQAKAIQQCSDLASLTTQECDLLHQSP